MQVLLMCYLTTTALIKPGLSFQGLHHTQALLLLMIMKHGREMQLLLMCYLTTALIWPGLIGLPGSPPCTGFTAADADNKSFI